ncbi:pyridoxal phosphate-dependent transferase [Xylariaceae sp. FL0804]|nr:pyridoxal phosphate-dependent transferase [Xylariaceae sp. FL0804]
MESYARHVADDMAKPAPKDMSHHYSAITKARTPSKMKEYYKYFLIPGIGNLAGGLPNARFFPFDTLEAQTARPDRWTPTANRPGGDEPSTSPSGPGVASHLVVPHDAPTTDLAQKIDLTTALQYGQAYGYPPLMSFIRQFAREALHPNVPYRGGPEVVSTVGSTDGMAKTLEVFSNVWIEGVHDVRDRPGMLSEIFMYPNVLNQAQPRGIQVCPVEIDQEGMAPYGPGGLEDVLENWDESKGKRPHLMYTVTMGHNPTSGVLSLQRRKDIYALCSKYDVIIIEDDPYWYLQYPSAEAEEAKARNQPIPQSSAPANTLEKKSGFPFLDSLVPSFLGVDVDGRVVRLDTFSKTVAPGCRLGWITAAPEVCERILRVSESGTQQPSGFVQAFVAETIMGPQPEEVKAQFAASSWSLRRGQQQQAAAAVKFGGWKLDGWVRWLAGLRGEYERRMNRMCAILEEHAWQLKQSTPVRPADADWGVITRTRLYDFDWPRGGMFLWLRVHFETHPLWHAPRTRPGPTTSTTTTTPTNSTTTSTSSGGGGEGGGGGGGAVVVDGPALSMALMVFLTRRPHLVLVSPGAMFAATPDVALARGWRHYRMCFAAETDANVDACSLRFARGLHRFWRIRDVRELEDILDETTSQQDADADVDADVEGLAEGLRLADLAMPMGC